MCTMCVCASTNINLKTYLHIYITYLYTCTHTQKYTNQIIPGYLDMYMHPFMCVYIYTVISQPCALLTRVGSEDLQRVVSNCFHVGINTWISSRSCGSGCVEGLGRPSTCAPFAVVPKGRGRHSTQGGAFVCGVWTRVLLLWRIGIQGPPVLGIDPTLVAELPRPKVCGHTFGSRDPR